MVKKRLNAFDAQDKAFTSSRHLLRKALKEALTIILMEELKRTKCEIYTRVMGYYRPVTQFNN